ncbi:DNA topoisomerase IV subunit B [Paucibacter soli]|uniref:DNA topoisomerase IV subunit B n=1 Tax=Paucibacter soli TaxID=3133433 RepID=UPI0030A3E441
MATSTPKYDESAIRVLKGLEPVKQMPGMYTRTDCPLHIIQEVLDNATDEAIGGYAKNIRVELLADGCVQVADDGRGIPVGLHPEEGVPVVELVFTRLHAGGKFDKANGGAYKFSGGLHGVGVSVTNALSDMLRVEVTRDGRAWMIEFSNGDVSVPLKKLEKAEGTGTKVTVRPNPKYFDSPALPVAELCELLHSKAVLLPGLTVTLVDASRPGEDPVETVFRYENGMAEYLDEMTHQESLVPKITGAVFAGPNDESFSDGEGAAWVLSWYENGDGAGRSFVNLIPTPQHGTHLSGLRAGVFNAIRNYIDHQAMLPKGVKLTADDAFKSARFVLSARILEPRFDNQTKDRLNSRDAVKLVERMSQPVVEAWLNHNPVFAKAVAEIVIRHAQARQRAAKVPERRKGSSVVMLPGKLAPCESEDPAVTELFLVEGDSAGGSAKQGRSKENQAILPLRGKGKNSWEQDKDEVLANNEIHDISIAIGVQPHGPHEEVDLSGLRYGKICILADADVDGFHIQCLLLTLFLRHYPRLVEKGHIYIAKPPLYRLDADRSGKSRPPQKIYCMDEGELSMWQDRLRIEGYTNVRSSRFKGLGEMNPPELWETTLSPETRRLVQVQLPEDQREEAHQLFDNLMAKGQVSWRRAWMERRGDEVEAG